MSHHVFGWNWSGDVGVVELSCWSFKLILLIYVIGIDDHCWMIQLLYVECVLVL